MSIHTDLLGGITPTTTMFEKAKGVFKLTTVTVVTAIAKELLTTDMHLRYANMDLTGKVAAKKTQATDTPRSNSPADPEEARIRDLAENDPDADSFAAINVSFESDHAGTPFLRGFNSVESTEGHANNGSYTPPTL